MAGHARNSPSDATRWMGCAGALNRCKKLGLDKSETSFAAAEGTAAHWVVEQCLKYGFDPYDFIGESIDVEQWRFTVDEDMAENLQPGLDRVRELPGQLFVESRVNTTWLVGKDEDGNDQFGTLDTGLIPKLVDDEWVIKDLKYGAGIPVQAVRNKQIRIYGLSFWRRYRHLSSSTRFRFIIDQPRRNDGGGEWTQTLDELLEFADEVKEKAKLTFDPSAPCTPGKDQCQWCPASRVDGACPEFEEWNLEFMGLDFEDLDAEAEMGIGIEPTDIDGLTVSRRKAIYDHLHLLRRFLDRIEAGVKADVFLGEGEKFGLKAVAGKRSRRKHRDEEISQQWLIKHGYSRDKIIIEKLKTPAMLDKVCGKGKFPKELIVGGEPTPSIVPMDDARPALLVDSEVFENFDETDLDFDD